MIVRRARGLLAAGLMGLLGLLGAQSGCRETPAPDAPAAGGAPAPATAAPFDAALRFTPQPLRIGDVLEVEVVVSSPPGHHLQPFAPPALPQGWLLDHRAGALEADARRWRQRVVLHVRPRALGSFVWPASEVVLSTPEGGTRTLALPARTLDVIATSAGGADASTARPPHGLRAPAAGATSPGGFGAGFASGVFLVALGLLGWRLVPAALARRRARDRALRERATRRDLGDRARAELAALHGLVASQPREVSSRAALLLRRYVRERFDVATVTATTQELAATPPPREAAPRWSDFIRLLRRFDDVRFRPGRRSDPATTLAGPEEIDRALEETERFVADSQGDGRRR